MRELRIVIGCIEIHEADCVDGDDWPPRKRTSKPAQIEVNFLAGQVKGAAILRGDQIPLPELDALKTAIQAAVLRLMTTEAASEEPDAGIVDSILSGMRETDGPGD